MTLGIVDEGTEATPASMPALLPCLEAAEEFQDMPELEDVEPENDPREEALVDVPPIEAVMDLESMPQLQDGGSKESREEYLANVPPMKEPLAQPWVRFEAQICQDEVQH